eukprot:CAMPEP_0197440606 /NCGR_PEP_ID=MMETSP1175-20131217/7059_1 /TAXON_ID=1003142 /ORGANISM="Triceratium dubium, Strain CCMP147" /LENGTH=817 /DNA_ID=CAMNT_0042970741 /DNA_START=502 /DNA_END=2955 /DNA_ORIENTATION=+
MSELSGNASRPSRAVPASPMRQQFSRRNTSRIRTNDLPVEKNARGVYTGPGIFFACIKLTVPLAYVYILLVLLRELCVGFPETIHAPITHYLPHLDWVVRMMKGSSLFMEIWAVVEAIFYICLKLHIQWLQRKDPLEASLSAAPMLELGERRELWERMMESEADDPVSFITGWFFDEDLDNISKQDTLEFGAWSMFEGRNLEHLTRDELDQLHDFVEELEWRISIYLHGVDSCSSRSSSYAEEKLGPERRTDDEEAQSDVGAFFETKGAPAMPKLRGTKSNSSGGSFVDVSTLKWSSDKDARARPHECFHFQACHHNFEPTFFSNLYENYKQRYEQYQQMMENMDFRPVQGLRNFVAEKRQQIVEAEEKAMNAASQMYESAYFTVVDKGSNFDKRLTALSHATRSQLNDAWNSMCSIKERLDTANFVSKRRKALRQQLKGYHLLLDRMRSQAVPSKQMAAVMLKITQCTDALELVEGVARDAFVKATGFTGSSLLSPREPKMYAKYSSDPLLGLSTYPLMFHLLILGLTEGGLRVMMLKRGFEKKKLGPISYYYHPGTNPNTLEEEEEDEVPIVFCHGIGVGLIVYVPLIDSLLKTGRPILLPEIPYVSGFRPWQSPHSILQPAAVSSTLTAMLASHGHLRAAFIGHSYGTSWLSYMCKYAPSVMAAVLFLDPICFCLHYPCLTKGFVYHRPDPGSTSYMIRTDVIVNWTIQRSFPWARISLFVERIPDVPCAVFISECDALVPAAKVERYLRSKGAPVKEYAAADNEHFSKYPINVTIFPGDIHGDWTERPATAQRIGEVAEILCSNAPKESHKTR